jgi:preprotein translocase subunit YajC
MPSPATITLFVSAAKPTTQNTGASYVFLAVVAVVFFVIYRYFMKPRQRAAQMQRNTLLELEPGDEVLTGAGIFGTVQHIQGDRVTLWTGTGSTITVLRRTIARKLEDDDADYDPQDEHASGDHDSWENEESQSQNGTAALDGPHEEHDVAAEPADTSTEEEDR